MRSKSDDQLKLLGDFVHDVHDLTPEDVERFRDRKPKTLGIRCSRTDCTNNLHCFDGVNRKHLRHPNGHCQECGKDLIEWDRMWLRDSRDIGAKFQLFQAEWIRHFFFHVPITPRVGEHAHKHGRSGLASLVEKQLRRGTMIRFSAAFDRRQTPMLNGTIVEWARHAVACCCRQCMNYWHNVPLNQELTNEDIRYFTDLVLRFIGARIPDLGEGPKMAARPERPKAKAN